MIRRLLRGPTFLIFATLRVSCHGGDKPATGTALTNAAASW
jgi:hypothetical protein